MGLEESLKENSMQALEEDTLGVGALPHLEANLVELERSVSYSPIDPMKTKSSERLICPACMLLHGKVERIHRACPKRFCTRMKCTNAPVGVPYIFMKGCFCNAHVKFRIKRPAIDAKLEEKRRRLDVVRGEGALIVSALVENEDSFEGPELSEGVGFPVDRGEMLPTFIGTHGDSLEHRYVQALRSSRVASVLKGQLYCIPEPSRTGFELLHNNFVHVVPIVRNAVANVGDETAIIWICDCESNPMSRLLRAQAKDIESLHIDGEVFFNYASLAKSSGFHFCIHARACSRLFESEVVKMMGRRFEHVKNWIELPRVAESNRRLFTVSGAQFETERRGVQQVVSDMRGAPELERQQTRGSILFERALVAVQMLQPEDKVEVARCLQCPTKCSHSCVHVRTLQASGAKVSWAHRKVADRVHRGSMRRHTGGDGQKNNSGRDGIGVRLISYTTARAQVLMKKRLTEHVPSSKLYRPKQRRCICPQSQIGMSHMPATEECSCGARCPHCNSVWDFDSELADTPCSVFEWARVREVDTWKVQCSGCDATLRWDGDDEAIFRATSATAVVYELLQDALQRITSCGADTFAAIHRSYEKRFEMCSQKAFMTRDTFNRVMWSFIDHLDRDWEALFTCPHCGALEKCRTITVDGTTAAPTREALEALEEQRHRIVDDDVVERQGTSMDSRVFFVSKDSRNTVAAIAKSSSRCRVPFEDVALVIRKEPYMENMLRMMLLVEDGACFVKEEFRRREQRFLSCLSKMTTVRNGLVKNPELISAVLQEWVASEENWPSSSGLMAISKYFPSLAVVTRGGNVADATSSDGTLRLSMKEWLHPVLERIIDRLKAIGDAIPNDEFQPGELKYSVDELDDLRHGCFLPSLKKQRPFHRYSTATRDWVMWECNKDYHGRHLILLPGILTILCPHGFFLGFILMTVPESPETVFSMLFGRFPDANRVVIYDNGCKLLEYCMNREPRYFWHTVFLQDRLHGPPHVGCTLGHNVDSFWWAQLLNTQTAEQGNAVINRIKSQVSFMSIYNFSIYMRFFLSEHNEAKKVRIMESIHNDMRFASKIFELHSGFMKQVESMFPDTRDSGHEQLCACCFCSAIPDIAKS